MLQVRTALKCPAVNFPQPRRKNEFLQTAVLKAPLSDILDSLWETDAPKVGAALERAFSDRPQCAPLLEHDLSQTLAVLERGLPNVFHALRDGDFAHALALELALGDRLRSVRDSHGANLLHCNVSFHHAPNVSLAALFDVHLSEQRVQKCVGPG